MNHSAGIFLPYAMSYACFFLLLLYSSRQHSNRLITPQSSTGKPTLLIRLHVAGIFLLGIVPMVTGHLSPAPIYPAVLDPYAIIVIVVAMAVVFMALFQVEKDKRGKKLAVMHGMNSLSLVIYFIVRLLFIAVYEQWFRGFFLQDCLAVFGTVAAIIINIILYTLLHTMNGRKEMLGCIPFGALLCFLCLWQGGTWPAILVHLVLTLFYEIGFTYKTIKRSSAYGGFNYRGVGIYRK